MESPDKTNPGKDCLAHIAKELSDCRNCFEQILTELCQSPNQTAYEAECSIFKKLFALGLLLLRMFFALHKQGDYGAEAMTNHGRAKRTRLGDRSYYSIFGKLDLTRYLYEMNGESVALLDRVLCLPKRCYSYFLCEWVNHLNIFHAYQETEIFLQKFLGLSVSVSAAETISLESSSQCETFYAEKQSPSPEKEAAGALNVVGFDGKGVPMIKSEAAKIKARLDKGEKRQKKKEALVGVSYTIEAQPRQAEDVARNLVYPEQTAKKEKSEAARPRTTNTRYVASIKKPKRAVMREIYDEVSQRVFTALLPLICLIDGANSLIRAMNDVFKDIAHRVTILDIIHVLEYIWEVANACVDGDQAAKKAYVYEKLKLILQGKTADYVSELETELTGKKGASAKAIGKAISYFNNHKAYMKYDEYLAKGYPIATGVIESACGHVVKDRMEIAGARWGIDGAEAILRLRSIVKSQDWEAYWERYRTQHHYEVAGYLEHTSMDIKQLKIA